MEHVILYAVVPVAVVMALGFICGRRGAFDIAGARVLDKLVLDFALPATLFVSVMHSDVSLLRQNIYPAIVALCVIMGCFMLVYFVYKHCFKGNGGGEGAVMALLCGSPAIGFMGFAVLQPIFGATPQVGMTVAIVGIVVNAVGIPVGLSLLNISRNGSTTPSGNVWHAILGALKQPVAWAPIVAVILVACGVHWDERLSPSLELLAGASAATAVFSAGITLSQTRIVVNKQTLLGVVMKIVLMPALFLTVGIALNLDSTITQMLVVAGTLPPAFTGTMIAGRYDTYVANGASSLALSVIAFIPACPLWLHLASSLT